MNTLAEHPHILPGFIVFVVSLLLLDNLVLRRTDAAPSLKSAVAWTCFWIGIAASFAGFLALYLSFDHAVLFVTGYVIEMSLSVDNLFVFILIFSSFKVPTHYQHRVLYWGVMGALVMRAICIWAGVSVLQRFEWLEFIFAMILIWAGIKTWRESIADDESGDDPTQSKIAFWVKKFIPMTTTIESNRFFVIRDNRLFATPLFLVLIMVEVSDIIFAVDSIPAVLAVSRDEFIVYSSNIFAILGLRNLYFILNDMMHKFPFLDRGVSFILVFVGVKMALAHVLLIPPIVALSVISLTLFIAMIWPQTAQNSKD